MKQKNFFLLLVLFAISFAYITNYYKKIETNVMPVTYVIPGGDCIGIKLYSKGVLIIGESKIQSIDGNYYSSYNDEKFEAGDILLKINDYEVESAEEVSNIINNNGSSDVLLTCERNGKVFEKMVTPIKSIDDGKYKIGIWVRDGAMGVGTLSFYLPQEGKYAALGHGISDEDSKKLIEIEEGKIYDANILSLTKGMINNPGEIKGFLDEYAELGTIDTNSENGIYGSFDINDSDLLNRKHILVARKNEVKTGPAKILCTVDETQQIKEYDIEIVRISSFSDGMVIKVTDEELINKTGGIIQGMSGSPIIQNEKLVGAVTHVYVNNPLKGFAIFAETMVEEM